MMTRKTGSRLITPGRVAIFWGVFFLIAAGWIIREMLVGDSGQIKGVGNKPGAMIMEVPDRVDASSPFVMSVVIDTKGKPVNAVGIHASFDTNRLEIMDIDTSASFCQFYPENRFDNQRGTLKISCGAPSPGFTGRGTIAKIRFLPKTIGNAGITLLPDSQILLNDGKGTNILDEFPEREILIVGGI